MIVESHLYNFIKNNKEKNKNIFKLLKNIYKLQITENKKENLVKISYNNKSKIEDELVKECKNIIMDYEYNIICYSSPKSQQIEYFEKNITNWKKDVSVQLLLEGIVINVFYHNNKWLISYNKNIENLNSSEKYVKLFIKSLLFNNLNINNFSKDYCYIFNLSQSSSDTTVFKKNPLITLLFSYKITNGGEKIEYIPIGFFKNQFQLVNILRNFGSINEINEYLDVLNNNNKENIVNGFVLRYKTNHCVIKNINEKVVKKVVNKVISNSALEKEDTILFYLNIIKKKQYKLLKKYPQHKTLFKNLYLNTRKCISDLYKYYHKVFVKKEILFKNIPQKYKKYCFELHKDFKYKLIPNNYVSKSVIHRFWKYIPMKEKKQLLA